MSESNFKSVKACKPQIKWSTKQTRAEFCGLLSLVAIKWVFYDLARTLYFVQCKKPR